MRNFGMTKPPKFLNQPMRMPAEEPYSSTYFAVSMTLLLAGAMIIVAVFVFINTAIGATSSGCMTKAEARALHPTKHLFWHGRSHCWNAEPGLGSRKSRWLPRPSEDANGNVAHHSGAPLIVEPPAMTEAQIDEMQFNEEAERRLTGCCWPPLEEPDFAERWSAVPSTWMLAGRQ